MRNSRTTAPADGRASGDARRFTAAMASLFVPGAGHLMIGRRLRGAIWLAGFVALALTGALHLLPGLILMFVAAADAWWLAAPTDSDGSPKEGQR